MTANGTSASATRKTTLTLSWAEADALQSAVSYLSESEGNGPEADALLARLYDRLDQALGRLEN
jgi:hypothetical protein